MDDAPVVTSKETSLPCELPKDLSACHAVIHQLHEALHRQQRENEQLQHRLQQLLRARFGQKADRLNPNQLVLFAAELIEEVSKPEPAAKPSEKHSANKGNGHGRRKLPQDLPRQRVEHDLSEEEKRCPCCGDMRVKIGQESSEQLEYEPAKIYVIEHIRPTYACQKCQGQVETASKPLSPIEKGLAGPGLLAQVITSKYGDHQPLYRQEQILERSKLDLSRSTMGGWMASCAALLRPLVERMIALIVLSKWINTDDTPVPVLDPQRGKTKTGRLWTYLGDRNHPYTVYVYTPTRSRDGPSEFFGNYAGYIQADAYGGYDHLFKRRNDGGPAPTEVGCWAHARRKFVESESSDALRAHTAVAMIRLLYDVEREARQLAEARLQSAASTSANVVSATPAAGDERARAAKLGEDPAAESLNEHDRAARLGDFLAQTRLALRRERSTPRLEQLKAWLEAQKREVLPKSPMGTAIDYCLSNWTALTRYVEDGDLDIDNNAAENALRPVALGRKNWLFAGSDNGGHTGATLMGLVASCKRHGIDPYVYLRDVLTRIAATPISELDQFLPDRWKATRLTTPATTPQ